MSSPVRPALFALLIAHLSLPAPADVVINELMANGSERLLRWSAAGVPTLGFGTPWQSGSFNDASWQTGAGPFGFGTLTTVPAVAAFGTNMGTQLLNLTPTMYLRKTFTVSAGDAARTDALQFSVEYNDGFVAFLNGVEVARRNAGPANKFIYHDQPAYNREVFSGTAPIPTTTLTEVITIPQTPPKLVSGANVLAIQALNASATDATFYFKAALQLNGAPTVALVNFGDTWKYLPGVVEPSGNLYDPALLGSGRQNVAWGKVSFDDATWATGTGPIGAGSPGVALGTNLTAQVVNLTPSVYLRKVFTATAADLAQTLPLQLTVRRDDGFVAYINGVEVARASLGLPNTFTPHDAVADAEANTTVTYTLDPPAKLLVAGSNVLAVQVHNYATNNSDLLAMVDLKTNAAGSNVTLVANNTSWRYLVGTVEPIPDFTEEEEESTPDGPDSVVDWVELYNNGASAVSLNGWTLTDDAGEPAKWTFPNVSIPAGGYLTVICDGLDLTSNPGGYLHTNFSLSADGEYLGLRDNTATLVSELPAGFPKQLPFYSYVRDAGGVWRHSDTGTPGAANGGVLFDGIVATPTVSVPGRFYTGSVSVSLACATPSATLRYTTDGSDPSATSTIAAGALSFATSTALKARAFRAGYVPSEVITHTYLLNQTVARQSLPAVCLTGDLTQALYRPFGVFAIVNNNTNAANGPTNYTGGQWSNHPSASTLAPPNTAEDPSLYNAPMQSGKPAERPVAFEVLHSGGTADLRTGAGLRAAGSPYSRHRYILANQNSATPNSASPWTSSATEKPQLNLFFRDELGPSPLSYPLVPGSVVRKYENIRLRAGKNDISNPFIRDEFARRLLLDMGQVCVRGDFVNVYVNSVFKGYFNITERPREPFFQEARGTGSSFDVRHIAAIADGDILAYNELVNYANTHNAATYADYLGLAARVDVVNVCDYVIVNVLGATADWPGNNYVMDRERVDGSKWRFSIWDAEGGFGGFGRTPQHKSFPDLSTGNPAGLMYTKLKASPEFRLLFADRIQKHLFNNGALTDANLQAKFNLLAGIMQPMIGTVSPFLTTAGTYGTSWLTGKGDSTRYTPTRNATFGINGNTNCPSRRIALFDGYLDESPLSLATPGLAVATPGYFVSEGLWPATKAPVFSTFGGTVAPGSTLTITNPSGSGTIYYTTNGIDPRAVGGAAQGTTYASPIAIYFPTTVRARVRSTGGEWSPLTEATFEPGTVAPLLISEVMYHPPDIGAVSGDEYEFIELKNIGTQTVTLAGMRFTAGLDYTFPAGSTIAPGQLKVLARNSARFLEKYPTATLLGEWGPESILSDSSDTLTLTDASGQSVTSFTYFDSQPWPTAADGSGPSLVPVNPNANPSPGNAAFWRASTNNGGSPGADDPAPAVLTIHIQELLANPLPGDIDRVEFFNPNTTAVVVGDWWLSDDNTVPQKFRIPTGTSIPAGGYLVLTESDFNTGPTPFAFSANGDAVRLSSGDITGALTGWSQTWSFGASDPGVSFGRYVNSQSAAFFTAQRATSLGAANAGPLIGPVVFTELMPNPAAGGEEFVEIRNLSTNPVPLYDPTNPTNTWKIDGLGFSFPGNTTLQPGQIALIVPGVPSVFRSRYGIPAAIAIFGPYGGAQNNAGERLALQKPGVPYLNAGLQTVVPYIDIDYLTYSPSNPWPTTAAGTGRSLERIYPGAFGDDPLNWSASATTAATPGILRPQNFANWRALHFTAPQFSDPATGTPTADPDGDGSTNLSEWAAGTDPWAAGSSAVAFSIENASAPRYLNLSLRRSFAAAGLSVFGDTSGNLITWTLGGGIEIGPPVNNGDGTETVTFRDPAALGSSPAHYLRLRLVAP